ncbi:colicin-like bacteriocin tRNase domain-containing protein, partial [Escherichia coli]
GTNIKDVYSAPVSPNLPDLVLSVGQMNTPVLSNPEIQRSEERRVGKECSRPCVDLGGRRIIKKGGGGGGGGGG